MEHELNLGKERIHSIRYSQFILWTSRLCHALCVHNVATYL